MTEKQSILDPVEQSRRWLTAVEDVVVASGSPSNFWVETQSRLADDRRVCAAALS